jgi:molybdenum cofactor synthesis domain-containing protein
MIRVGVLTVSDRCARREREDESGPAIQAALPADRYVIALYAVVPDDKKMIQETLRRWSDEYDCDVILTTGGTGLAPRDFTPEATERILHRSAPNIALYLALEGMKKLPQAALSRAVAGVRGNTLIVNLPGSPAAASEYAKLLDNLLPHAVAVIRDPTPVHPAAP